MHRARWLGLLRARRPFLHCPPACRGVLVLSHCQLLRRFCRCGFKMPIELCLGPWRFLFLVLLFSMIWMDRGQSEVFSKWCFFWILFRFGHGSKPKTPTLDHHPTLFRMLSWYYEVKQTPGVWLQMIWNAMCAKVEEKNVSRKSQKLVDSRRFLEVAPFSQTIWALPTGGTQTYALWEYAPAWHLGRGRGFRCFFSPNGPLCCLKKVPKHITKLGK